MILRSRIFYFLILSVITFSSGCRKWDDHIQLNDPALGETLLQKIQETQELSKFNEYLVKTGYDQVLASAKLFTVWAPDNQALAGLDASIINDAAKLKQFIGNHIGFEEYFTSATPTTLRI